MRVDRRRRILLKVAGEGVEGPAAASLMASETGEAEEADEEAESEDDEERAAAVEGILGN